MISDQLAKAVQHLERLLKLLWFGQFFSLGIYIVITMRRVEEMGDKAAEMSPLVPILGFCGAAVLIVAFAIRWLTFSPRALSKVTDRGVPKWIGLLAGQSNGLAVSAQKVEPVGLDEPESNLFNYSKKLFPVMLIQWGCAHSVALYGMILPSPQPIAVIVSCGITTVAMFFMFPNIGTRFAAGLELASFEKGIQRN